MGIVIITASNCSWGGRESGGEVLGEGDPAKWSGSPNALGTKKP